VIFPRAGLRYERLPGRGSADPLAHANPDGFCMRVVVVEGTGRRTPHRHPRSQEAIYVARGRGVLWEDGTARVFASGDCALIEPGVAHATIAEPGTSMELVCFFPLPDLKGNIEELEAPILLDHERRKGGE
jgi:quercetin dioxygenase-like cupin family protein